VAEFTNKAAAEKLRSTLKAKAKVTVVESAYDEYKSKDSERQFEQLMEKLSPEERALIEDKLKEAYENS
jgi:hypothetical protein